MKSLFEKVQSSLRCVTCVVFPFLIGIMILGTLMLKFSEFSARSELLSISSFAVLLTLSALAFNWCRVSTPILSEKHVVQIHEAAVDLFLASLLALGAAFFSWLKTSWTSLPQTAYTFLFFVHMLLLGGSLILAGLGIVSILQVIRKRDAALD